MVLHERVPSAVARTVEAGSSEHAVDVAHLRTGHGSISMLQRPGCNGALTTTHNNPLSAPFNFQLGVCGTGYCAWLRFGPFNL